MRGENSEFAGCNTGQKPGISQGMRLESDRLESVVIMLKTVGKLCTNTGIVHARFLSDAC